MAERSTMCARVCDRPAVTDYTAHIHPGQFNSIVNAYTKAQDKESPLKMTRAKIMQMAQYCAALPWLRDGRRPGRLDAVCIRAVRVPRRGGGRAAQPYGHPEHAGACV